MTPLSAPPSAARVGIVGAGLAGLGVAFALRGTRAQVALVEKSRGPSGRAATRRRDGFVYDFGANFIDLAASPEVRRVVEACVPAEHLVAVEGEVWTHDVAGVCTPGRPSSQQRYSTRDGLNRVGHGMLAAGGGALHAQVRAARVERQRQGWWVEADQGKTFGPFDVLVLTPPAPQSAALLPAADPLAQALRQVPYAAQFSAVLALKHRLAAHEGVYAYLNADRAHPVAWLAFESRKRGHVPEGREALVVQMAPAWTEAHFDDAPEGVAEAAAACAAALLGAPLEVAWSDVQRWRYALPVAALDAGAAAEAEGCGLYVASDAVPGRGRAAGAIQIGLDVGRRIRDALGL